MTGKNPLGNSREPQSYEGLNIVVPVGGWQLIKSTRAPTTNDKKYPIGSIWINTTTSTSYQLVTAPGVWTPLGSGTGGDIQTLTGGTGGALLPTAGNMNLLGTANQITSTGSGSTITFSIPSAFTAPGSITATTTVTATLGNITATNGNFVGTAAGTGIVLNSAQASGVAASPVVVNGRSGRATFTSVSIAAAADLTLTITNSSITASTTEVMLSMSGATTGSALSIKSKTASSGSLAIVVTNGTGATTTTADIQIDFLILNA